MLARWDTGEEALRKLNKVAAGRGVGPMSGIWGHSAHFCLRREEMGLSVTQC